MGHPGARSGGVGEGAAIEMCHSGGFTFTYCPHSAPTTPEMMMTQYREKERLQGKYQ